MRKIIIKSFSVFISVLLTFSSLSFLKSASAINLKTVENSAILYSENQSVESGAEIAVPVYISGNAGFAGFKITLRYDTEVFIPQRVETGNLFNEIGEGSSGFLTDSVGGSVTDRVDVIWSGSEDIIGDGLLFTVYFKTVNSANGDFDISFTSDAQNTFDEEFNDVLMIGSTVKISIDGSKYDNAQRIFIDETKTDGGKLILPVNIINNAGLEPSSFTLCYDGSVFTPVSVKGVKASVIGNNISNANGNLQIITGSVDSLSGDGELFEVVFDAAEKTNGNYYFDLINYMGLITEGTSVHISDITSDLPTTVYSEIIKVENEADTIDIPVKIKNNHGMMGFKIALEYDRDIIVPVSLSRAGGILSEGSFDYNIRQESELISVIWNNSNDVSTDGVMFIITCRIISDEFSDSQITVSYSEEDTFNSEWDNVLLQCEDIYLVKEKEIITAKAGTGTIVKNGIIYGIEPGLKSLDSKIDILSGYNAEYDTTKTIGTGTVISAIKNGITEKLYKVVIFGDVNGDGWYDGMDATIVSCLANGMLSLNDVSDTVSMAADCNHDGAIDQLDVDILQQAGILLSQVDQSKSEEELIETSSAYVEYLNLIDQNVSAEDNTDNSSANEPANPTVNPFSSIINVFEDIIAMIKAFIDFVKAGYPGLPFAK